MALIGKAGGVRDFRQRQLRLCQKRLSLLQAFLREVMVWGRAGGLLKLPGKMVHRQSRDRSQCRQVYRFAQMKINIVPYPAHRARRQAATQCLRWRCELHECANRVQARTRVSIHVRRVSGGLIWWRNKRGTAVVTTGNQERRVDIRSILATKQIEVSFEEFPQAKVGLQSSIIQQEGTARGAVYADDALVIVNGEQHADGLSFGRNYSYDPLAMKLLAKKSLFYGAG